MKKYNYEAKTKEVLIKSKDFIKKKDFGQEFFLVLLLQ